MSQFKKTVLAASVLALLPSVSFAQLEEVVVTASKRVESLQDVPMSISAISGESMVRLGVDDFTDIAKTVPGLAIRSSGPGRTKLNIRGISAATGVAPTVSFYIDEMPISTISSGSSTSFAQTIIDPKMYDLERVEVLRGPQGTLYGSSSMGGTVRVLTGQPLPGESEGSINAEISDTKGGDLNYLLNGMYNVPTSDNSALRLVGSWTDRDGYIDRVDRETGEKFDTNVNTEETLSLRGAWRYEWDSGYIQPFVFYQKNEMDGKPSYDGPSSKLQQVRLFDQEEPFDDEFTMVNFTYNQDFGQLMNLVVSLSNIDREFTNAEDLTDQTFAAVGEFETTGVYADELVELDDTTFEARLSSTNDFMLQWLAGVYYKDSEADSGYRMQRGFDPALSVYGLANTQDNKTYEEYAVFGDISIDLGERFTLALGGRYLDYDYSQYKEDWGFVYAGGSGGTSRDEAQILDLDVSEDDVHGRFTATYHFTDVAQAYATVSNGSRPGGGNRSIPRSKNPAETTAFACDQDLMEIGISGSPDSYTGDEVVNTELGWKTDIGDRVRFNGALYHMKWDDIQQVVTTSGDCGFNFTTNLGEAVSQGVELEMYTAVTDNLGMNFSLGYTDAEFKDDIPAVGIEKGDLLADVPEWTFNFQLDWVIPMSSGDIFTVFNYSFVDETLELAGQPDDDISDSGIVSGNVKPDYQILDLRVGWASQSNWEAVVFVDNLTDEEAIYTYSDVLAFNIPAYDRTVRNRPRTYGLSFTYNF